MKNYPYENNGAKDNEILIDQVRQMYDLYPLGLIASFLNSLIVFFVLRTVIPRTNLFVWLAAMMLIIIFRTVFLARYKKKGVLPGSAKARANRAIAGLFLSGAAWGSSAIFLFSTGSMSHQVFLAFVLGGMTAGAAATFSQLKAGYPAFSVPALVPLAVRFFLIPGEFHLAMGVLVVFFLVVLWRVSMNTYHVFLTSLLLRYENRDFIGNMKREKLKVDELNRALRLEIEAKERAESELRAHEERLETTVEERTEELKNYKEKLEGIVEQKQILLKELYHRTKNNMQVISMLISLQSASIKDDRVVDALQEINNRIRVMALVHEKLYQSKDLYRILLDEYLRELAGSIISTYKSEKQVTLSVQAQPVAVSIDVAIPCGLVLNEIISNSMKYAFPGKTSGVIEISIRDLKGRMELVVRDNGIGLPSNIDLEKTKTLGLRLIMNIVTKQLGGHLKVERENGTSFIMNFENK